MPVRSLALFISNSTLHYSFFFYAFGNHVLDQEHPYSVDYGTDESSLEMLGLFI